jgi:hypothetical protein
MKSETMSAHGKWNITIKTPTAIVDADHIRGDAKYLFGTAPFSGTRA